MEKNNRSPSQASAETSTSPEFGIQRIYVKDISFESPSAPKIFLEPSQPSTDVQLNVKTNQLQEIIYEVELMITVTTKVNDQVAFLVEVKQAGIFSIQGFNHAQLHRMLGAYCPNILFPYAREMISELTSRGGFPPFYLTPVNFDALYDQQMVQQQAAMDAAATGANPSNTLQ